MGASTPPGPRPWPWPHPGAESSAGADDRRAYFAVAPRLYNHVTLLTGGSRPRPPRLRGPGNPMEIEAIVPADVADELDVEVGQVLSAVPYGDSLVPFAQVTVTGLFERRDPGDDFWVLYDRVLQKGASLTVDSVPLFVDEGGYFAVMGPAFGRLETTYGWLLDVDTDQHHRSRQGPSRRPTSSKRSSGSTRPSPDSAFPLRCWRSSPATTNACSSPRSPCSYSS